MTQAEQFDLNLLVALDALLEHGSVTLAAKRLGITQSGMSHKLRRLREAFDDPLVVKTGQTLVATPRAEQLLGPLRRGLGELRDVLAGPRAFDPSTSERTFTIMSSDFAEFSILPLVLQRLSELDSRITVNLLQLAGDITQALESSAVDLVMGPALAPRSGLIQRKVAVDTLTCLVRHNHPGVTGELDLKTYLELPHLLTSLPGSGSSAVDAVLAGRGKSRRVTMRIPHFLGGPFIVARSDLVWTTSTSLAVEAARILPLDLHTPPLKLPSFGVYMTWHERCASDDGHRFVRELAAEATRAVVVEHVVPSWAL